MTNSRTTGQRRKDIARTILVVLAIGANAPAPAVAQSGMPSPMPLPSAVRPSPQTKVAGTSLPPPEKAATRPKLHPVPGRAKHAKVHRRTPSGSDPAAGVVRANAAARVQPEPAAWLNAIQQYAYADGALYQVYSAPGQITDIVLQEGEELVGPGPVAAGDTVRWVIGDTLSGLGATKRVHILVKPTRSDLATNLVINTARRTYHIELRATTATAMAAVSWTYPQDQLIAVRIASAEAARAAPVATGIDPAMLDFRYRIDGDTPTWRPVRAFDDGHHSYVEFPPSIETAEMPPLFVLGADGHAELVNYRVQGRYMVVDRLFDAAELRLGAGKSERHVRIARENGERGRRRS